MPAQVCSQDPKVKELFRQAIKAKMERTKNRVRANFEEEVPSWVSWALRPIVSVTHDLLTSRDNLVGDVGEAKASAALRLALPRECVLMNDIVLEVEPDEFIQVDHMVIAPSGVFLIETKAWQGAFLCHAGIWKRKEGNSLVRCKSPTAQNRRHQILFRRWLGSEMPDLPSGDWVRPVVLITGTSWLKVNGPEMPVFDICLGMAWYLRKESSGSTLSEADRKRIVSAIATAKLAERSALDRKPVLTREAPKPRPVASEEGRTRQGRRYVRIRGTKNDADDVWREYVAKGMNPAEVRADVLLFLERREGLVPLAV